MQALEQVGFGIANEIDWEFLKSIQEPGFGPGLPITTVFMVAKLEPQNGKVKGWLMSLENYLLSTLD